MSKPKISVIVPIHNDEKSLKVCFDSLFNQSFNDFEVICINDCYSDSSADILEEFKNKNLQINVIHTSQKLGNAPAKNIGLDLANGDYLFFLDTSMCLPKYTFEKLYNSITQSNSDIAVLNKIPLNNYRICLENFIETIEKINIFEKFKLYSKSFITKNSVKFIQEDNIYDEQNFIIKLLSNFPKLTFINYMELTDSIPDNEDKHRVHNKIEMKDMLNDVFEYLYSKNTKPQAEILSRLIKTSNLYNKYFEKSILFVIKYKFSKDEKYIKLLGVDLFKQKIKGAVKVLRIIGIPVLKKSVPPLKEIKFECHNSDLIKNYFCTLKTDNNNQDIENELKQLGKFYFIPINGNLGDSVICSSEYQYFSAKHLEYIVYNYKNSIITPHCIVFTGGGIFNRLYTEVYKNILKIADSPLMQRCVILPSSIYNCDDAVKAFDERFTIFCRERQSYEYCKSLNSKAKFLLADDMVINADFSNYSENFYNRHNFEKFLSCGDEYINYIKDKIFPVYQKVFFNILSRIKDISDYNIGFIIREDVESLKHFNLNVKTFDLSAASDGCFGDEALCFMISKLFISAINIFNIIVTDRLHVAICAAKLNKEVYLLDNSYKKNSSIYNFSLSGYKNVHLVSFDEIETNLSKYKQKEKQISNVLKNFNGNKLEFISFKDFLLKYGSIPQEHDKNKRYI